MNRTQNRRRDWSVIIFILPFGVLLMLFVGQLAIRMNPNWIVEGEMKSYLDPQTAAKQDQLVVPAISGDILTPASWWNTFLTPIGDSGSGLVFPPFVIFEPSATPSVTPSPTDASSTPSVTASATSTPVPSSTATATKKPKDDDTPTAPTTCTDPLATNNGGPLPCTYPPTTCTDPLANNNGGALPCIYPTSTPLVGSPTPVPTNVVGAPSGAPYASIPDGYYIIINLGSPILVVSTPSDTNADLVYYEQASAPGVQMDQVIISISMDGSQYYVVFNWGDGIADDNSNVGDVAGSEGDNQPINASELYDPDGAGSAPDTGILIDVDNADSNPPPGSYQYIAIQAPDLPSNTDTDVGFDSVDVVDVPIPTP